MKKKFTAIIAAIAMIVTMMPGMAFADSASSSPYVVQNQDAYHEGGLYMNKTLGKLDENGAGTITLETYVEGSVQTTSMPADIVLVLDVSGSMDQKIGGPVYEKVYGLDTSKSYYYIGKSGNYNKVEYCDRDSFFHQHEAGWYREDNAHISRNRVTPKTSETSSSGTQFYERTGSTEQTKLNALKTAVNGFIENVNTNAKENNVDHRIALVKFAGKNSDQIGNDTYRDNGYTYNYSQRVRNLTSVNTNADAAAMTETVNELTAAGATSADYGMAHAKKILEGISDDRQSNKIVVMFTDGEPNHNTGFDSDVANGTISAGKDIKDGGAAVYTIGVFDGADNSAVTPGTINVNKYMHYVSSNYPKAQSLSISGARAEGSAYYKVASDASEISGIFESISQDVQSVSLDETSVVRDVMSENFVVNNDAGEPKVSVSAYSGEGSFAEPVAAGEKIKATVAGGVVSVSGFDFEPVIDKKDGTYTGKKLIIEVPVKLTNDAKKLYGNTIDSNNTQTNISGIYVAGVSETEYRFNVPKVKIPYKADYEFKSANGTALPDAVKEQLVKPSTLQLVKENGTAVNELKGKAYTAVEVKDDNGILEGTWTFEKWDKESQKNVTSNVMFTGTWIYTEATADYTVDYQFVSGTSGKDLPSDVTEQLDKPEPVQSLKKYATADNELKDEAYTAVEVRDDNGVLEGTWTFKNWNLDEVQNITGNVMFTGTWIYTEANAEYAVDYRFISGTSDKELTAGVTSQLVKPDPAQILKKYDTANNLLTDSAYEDVNEEENGRVIGTWVFEGWDGTAVENVEGNVTFTGTWVFNYLAQPVEYGIDYQFISATDGMELPEDVTAQLVKPEPEKVEENGVAINSLYENEFVKVEVKNDKGEVEGVWTFEGWDTDEVKDVTSDTMFTGTWKYNYLEKPVDPDDPVYPIDPDDPAHKDKTPADDNARTGDDFNILLAVAAALTAALAGLAALFFRRQKQ